MKRQSGFTLIEVIVVVAIIAVLAAIGFSTLQKWIWRARVEEVNAVFSDLKMRQKAFYDSPVGGQHYVSNGWVPAAPPTNTQHSWPKTGDPSTVGFDTIGFRPDTKQLWHSYRMVACSDVALAPCNAGPCSANFTEMGEAGYILFAQGDVNGDGNIGLYCTTSQLADANPVIWPGNEDWPGQAGN